eukprot:CAMPEP_0194032778 /NCGR_PEP_ID=MMETSP0009_2-20130614/5650_1 /TAXON_ID=210454 /ORGANISM="Grammatophora oceanica, Strain CCMP 410" /LENGTH=515 /DNA_ID=CAMNT_0038673317 /DNA_START=8 /DNA_END=1552 /DNA_ORIENTATION=-
MAFDFYRLCSDSFGILACHAWMRFPFNNTEIPIDTESFFGKDVCPGVGIRRFATTNDTTDATSTTIPVHHKCPSHGENWIEWNGRRSLPGQNVFIESGRLSPTYAWVEFGLLPVSEEFGSCCGLRLTTLLPFEPGRRYELGSKQDEDCGIEEPPLVIIEANRTKCTPDSGYFEVLEVEYDRRTTWPVRFAVDIVVDCPNLLQTMDRTTLKVRFQSTKGDSDTTTSDSRTDLGWLRPTTDASLLDGGGDNDDLLTHALLLESWAVPSIQQFDAYHIDASVGRDEVDGGSINYLLIRLDGFVIELRTDNAIEAGSSNQPQFWNQSEPQTYSNTEYPCDVDTLTTENGLHWYGRSIYLCSCKKRRWTFTIHSMAIDDDNNNNQVSSLAADVYLYCYGEPNGRPTERVGWIRFNVKENEFPVGPVATVGTSDFPRCVLEHHFDLAAQLFGSNSSSGATPPETSSPPTLLPSREANHLPSMTPTTSRGSLPPLSQQPTSSSGFASACTTQSWYSMAIAVW